jgi:general secretion pathway protein K
VSSRSAERGVAVIMAMLTVALIAALAAAIVAAYGFAVDSVSGRHDLDQARWLARGAIDWARNVLAEDKRRTAPVDHFGEAWATKIPPTPVEEGEVGGEIEDLSGLFNLNLLVNTDGTPNDFGSKAFVQLLQILGETSNRAQVLAANLSHWIDSAAESADAYNPAIPENGTQPPNAPLITVDELNQVPGFDGDLVERLRPFVTAVGPGSRLNLNTAGPEVISAELTAQSQLSSTNAPVVTVDQARQIVAQRNIAYFKDLTDVSKIAGMSQITPDTTRFAVGSQYFLASGHAKFGSATTNMQVLLDRGAPDNNSQNWPTIVWQRIL